MDSKQIKNNLKQAKEAIKNKDIASALDLCKAVLKEDRNNYIALVLLGAAFQESDQKENAPNAFRKAIDIAPDQILAWQGLAVFYEKDDCNKHAVNLIPVYQRLLQMETDAGKWCDIVGKIQNVICKYNSDTNMGEIISTHCSEKDKDKLVALHRLLVFYLSQTEDLPDTNLRLYEEFLNASTIDNEEVDFHILFKLLYHQKKLKELLTVAEKQFESHSADRGFCEWLCKVCVELFVEDRPSVEGWYTRLPQCYQLLLNNDEGSVLALLAQSVYYIHQRAFLEARDTLTRCLPVNRGLFHGICLLAEAELRLLCVRQAQSMAECALRLRPGHTMSQALLARSLSLSDNTSDCNKAVEISLQLGNVELAVEARCEAHLKLKQVTELNSALKEMTHAPALAAFWKVESQASESGKELLTILEKDTPDCPEAWYRLGQLQVAAEQYNKACTTFLKCARLAPHWYTAYHALGELYAREPSLLDKARRCFQRSLMLHPSHTPTQMALSDVYSAIGDAENNLALLLSITQKEEGRWAWPRLGLQYSRLGDTSMAINCLCSALKSDPNNSYLLEALADAYLARGANGSALKSYQKVLQLKPGAFYPALQIATIKQITDLPEESLLEFRELVILQPDSVLALKGLCETCLCLARNFLSRRLLGLARDRLQEGLEAVCRGIGVRPELATLWKLAGDCLTLAASLPQTWNHLQLPLILTPKSAELLTAQDIQLLELGAKCFCRSIKLITQNERNRGSVWHDLALNYCLQVKLTTTEDAATLTGKALMAAKQSVLLAPNVWQHWNQLGIIAALPGVKKYSLAQHCFIKATRLDETVAVPWSNLGCLYLSLGELPLANKAFSAAQRIDSEFSPSWTGQALIAELVDNEDTMDLFRHATLLGFHPESCLGYGQWVCQTLARGKQLDDPHYVYSIEKMHAVPVAIDALTWATDEMEEEACGLNMLGCLLERRGLYRSSVEVLSQAVDHCPAQHRDKVLANFGRVLLKAGKVEDAIQVYKAVSKADLHTQCGLALALYCDEQYQEAYETYEAALDWWAGDDSTKAHLHVALAAVAYKKSGADGPEHAKSLLLKGNQLKPTSVYGLFAACSLGMLHSDLPLSQSALTELLKYQNQSEFIPHIALFQAYVKFIQGDVQGCVWSMSKTVHRQPTQAALWLHLALLILNKHSVSADYKVAAAAQCANVAITLGRTTMDVSKVLAVVSLSKLQSGSFRQALSASQHAVHLYPGVGEGWAVLAASCLAAQTPTPLRPLISHARQHTTLQRPLARWMSNFERKIAISSTS